MNKKYAIYYIFDFNYIFPQEVALVSFLLHNKWFIEENHTVIFGYYGKCDSIHKEEFNKIYNNIIWIDISNPNIIYNELFDTYIKNTNDENGYKFYKERYKVNLFNKFYIFDNIDYDKIIYLDTDIICVHDVKYLFEDNYNFAASYSPVTENCNKDLNILYQFPYYTNELQFENMYNFYTKYNDSPKINAGILCADKNINKYINKTTLETFINNFKTYVSTPTPEETFLNIYFEKHIDILKELSLLPLNVQSTVNSDIYRFYDLDKYQLFNPNFPKNDAYYELTKYDFIHLIQKPWSQGINSKEHVYSIWYIYVYFTMQILINKRNILDL